MRKNSDWGTCTEYLANNFQDCQSHEEGRKDEETATDFGRLRKRNN